MSLSFEQAFQQQEMYRATDEEVLRRIGDVTLVAFIGPTAAGKNFNMARLPYHQAGTLTNREAQPRDGDSPYQYLTGRKFLRRIERGTLIQYAAIPPDRFYGSDADCYEPGVNVMDVTSVAAETAYNQGFGAVRPIGVLAREKDWHVRLGKRFQSMDHDEIKSRLDEAEESIDAIIHSWGDDRLVIVSSQTLVVSNLLDMERYIASGEVRRRKIIQKVGKDMLDSLPTLRHDYLKRKT